MASVHKRPRSPYWYASWRDVEGRQFLRSTKQKNRQKAVVVAMEYERAEKMAGAGVLTESQARTVLDDILKRTDSGESLRSMSIEVFLLDWLASRDTRLASGSAIRYGTTVKQFLKSLGNTASKPITALTARHVNQFANERAKAGCSPQTVSQDVKIIRAALNGARRQGLITTNPSEAVELPEGRGIERGTFTGAEVRLLIDAAEGEWKTLIMVAYFTGARLSDCCRMQWQSIDLVKGTFTFEQGKTGKKLEVPIHGELHNWLEDLASNESQSPYVMTGMSSKGPGGRHGLSEGFKRIMRRAGLDLQVVEGKGKRRICRRTFHALRHSFTSALANAGVIPELRMKLTGHTTEAVHRGYSHHELAVLKEAVDKVPNLG